MALIIAKPGNSVYDNEKSLVLTSNRDCLVEIKSGTKNISNTGYFQHSLGYYPAYSAFMKVQTSTIVGVPNGCWSPCVGFIGNALDGGIVTIDSDKLYFETYTVYNDITMSYDYVQTDFYYSIFGNSINNAVGSGNDNVSGKLKIAKSGLSLTDITDVRQLKFFVGNAFKQDLGISGTTSVTLVDYDMTVKSVHHGLGYVPIVYAFENNNGSRIPYGNPDGTIFTYYVDSSDIYFVAGNFSATGGDLYDIKYVITRDKIV